MKFEDQCCKIKSKHMGVARIFQRGGHTESYRGYSLDCHLNSQDFSKGGPHWVIQRVLTRLAPEYCRLLTYKMAYNVGVHGHPRTPLATPLKQILFIYFPRFQPSFSCRHLFWVSVFSIYVEQRSCQKFPLFFKLQLLLRSAFFSFL